LALLLRVLPQHRRGPQPDLLADGGALGRLRGISLSTHHVVQRSREVRVGEPVGYDAIDDPSPSPLPRPLPRLFHPSYPPAADGCIVRSHIVAMVRPYGHDIGRCDSSTGGDTAL